MRRLSLILLTFFSLNLSAQELNCKLTINYSQIEGTNTSVFTTLESALNQFLNSTSFTNLIYAPEERIDCNFYMLVSKVEDNIFHTELQVQASRPVYGSSYTTPILNVRDQSCNFAYAEFDQMLLNAPTYDQNITAILAYYAYIIIGLDLDSYSNLGGTQLFTMAEQIVSANQSKSGEAESKGWKAFESNKNRYALVSNLTDDRYRPIREFFYQYHRLGLDMMTSNVDNAREKIATGLATVRQVNKSYPSSAIVTIFMDAKNDELVNIFKGHGSQQQRRDVYDLLTAINPASNGKYDAIIK